MFTWLRKSFSLVLIVGLLALNVLTLVSTTVFDALSGALETVAPKLSTNAARLRVERDAARSAAQQQRLAARAMKQRAVKRAARLTAIQAMEMGQSIVPVLGTAAVTGISLWELKEMCAGLNDMNEFAATFGIENEPEDANVLDQMCNPDIAGLVNAAVRSTRDGFGGVSAALGLGASAQDGAAVPSPEEFVASGQAYVTPETFGFDAQALLDSLPSFDFFSGSSDTQDSAAADGAADGAAAAPDDSRE